MTRDFTRTRAALAVYDAGAAEREAFWEKVTTDEQVGIAETWEREALDLVRLAFYEDTKEINSRANCMVVDLDFMRKCAGEQARGTG